MSNMNVSKMNAMALAYMQRGDYGSAVFILKRALGALKMNLGTTVDHSQVKVGSPVISSCVRAINMGAKKALSEGDVFEVFASAFEVPDVELQNVRTDSLASLVMLYNMGLCYQLNALSTGSTQHLHTARNVYKMALSVVERCLGDALTDPFLVLLLLALFNNMGHIHTTCYDAADTVQCMTALAALLESRTFAFARNGEASELFLFFEWNNTLAISNPLFAFAPAA